MNGDDQSQHQDARWSYMNKISERFEDRKWCVGNPQYYRLSTREDQ